MKTVAVAYLSLVAVMSFITFVAYGFDKRRAFGGGRRVPEQRLHLLAFLGGWPGALLGQRLFHHKSGKLSFLIRFWCAVLLHIATVGAVTYAFSG